MSVPFDRSRGCYLCATSTHPCMEHAGGAR